MQTRTRVPGTLATGLLAALVLAACSNATGLGEVEPITELPRQLSLSEEDVRDGNYNTYRMFVKLYGADAPRELAAEVEHFERLLEARIGTLPEALRAQVRSALELGRREMATSEIPAPILTL